MLTMFMAVSDERAQVADNTVFSFIETQPGYPLPVKEWFYPGRTDGLEFIYPKDQARTIAEHAREPILAANASNLHDLSAITVESVSPVSAAFPVASSAANITKSDSAAVLEEKPSATEPTPESNVAEEQQPVEQPQPEIAQNTDSDLSNQNIEREKPAEAPAVTEQTNNNNSSEELPRTAGELPLIGLIGLVCLGAGLGMKVISSNN
jgi:hypothetical protein